MRRLALAAALLALAAAGPALAASKSKVRKVVEAAGLMGWAAQDCSRGPSGDNVWERFFVDEDGYVVVSDMEGADGIPSYVVDARKLRNGDVWVRLEIDLGEPDVSQTYRLDGPRRRVWTLHNAEKTLLIQDGVWVGPETGQSVWLTRCPGAPPES